MKTLLLSWLGLLALAGPGDAASAYAGERLALGADARALALGGAYVALAEGATAGYWNPAGLATLEGRQLHLTHEERFGLVDGDFAALALPRTRLGNLAFSLLRVGVADIPFTALQDPSQPIGPDNRPVLLSQERSADYALYLSGGRRLHRRLEAGLSLKLLYSSVGTYSAHGFGLDAGLRLRLGWGLALAANLRDLTTTPLYWSTETTDHIRPSLQLGMAWTLSLAGGRATALLAGRGGGEAEDESGAAPLNAGCEYWYKNIALRAGLEEERRAFGLGFQPHRRLALDLAYLEHDGLDPTYRVSANFAF
jgi:hypothetical protein